MAWKYRTVFHPSFSSQFCNEDYSGLPYFLENSSLLSFLEPNQGILQVWEKSNASQITITAHWLTGLESDRASTLLYILEEWSGRSDLPYPICPASLIPREARKESLQDNRDAIGPAQRSGFFSGWFLLSAYPFWSIAVFPTFGCIFKRVWNMSRVVMCSLAETASLLAFQ